MMFLPSIYQGVKMGNKMNLADCVRLAEFAHFHQKDKSGADYIEHPKRVLRAVQDQGAMPYVQMAAVLHDITEDTPFTCDMLLDLGVPEAAVNIVRLVDRDASELIYKNCGDHRGFNIRGKMKWLDHPHDDPLTKDEYYYAAIRENPGAVQVKLADIGDNLQPWRLSYLPEATQERLRAKYAKAIELLT
jgi:(p)ppGpp synthase/HD superfamily hydrolase